MQVSLPERAFGHAITFLTPHHMRQIVTFSVVERQLPAGVWTLEKASFQKPSQALKAWLKSQPQLGYRLGRDTRRGHLVLEPARLPSLRARQVQVVLPSAQPARMLGRILEAVGRLLRGTLRLLLTPARPARGASATASR